MLQGHQLTTRTVKRCGPAGRPSHLVVSRVTKPIHQIGPDARKAQLGMLAGELLAGELLAGELLAGELLAAGELPDATIGNGGADGWLGGAKVAVATITVRVAIIHEEITAAVYPTIAEATDITAAHLDGGFEPGASFDWTSFGLRVTSTIYEVAERARVLWGGTAEGITGVHEWIFRESEGGVHVVTNESFAGAPVRADAARMQALLDASLVSWLGHLKAVAESRA
jgi:hypothetical protein